MATSWDAPEDILLYYSGTSELEPPKPYKMVTMLYQHAGSGVFVITLNTPKSLNSLSLKLTQELILLVEHAKRDVRCKVLIWTGAGRAFCSGGNFGDSSTAVPKEVMEGYTHAGLAMPAPDISAAGLTRSMIKFPKITMSAVNGVTIGGGVNVAFVWQDFSYVAQEATFQYPFAQLGLTPELGSSVLLARIVGLARAKELLQLGKEFSAQRAYDLGLCTEVVPGAEVVTRAVEAAKKLAEVPQFALRESKRLVNKDLIESIDQITQEEYDTIRRVVASPETQQRMMALVNKTKKSKL